MLFMLFKVIYSLWLSGTALGDIFSSEERGTGLWKDAGCWSCQGPRQLLAQTPVWRGRLSSLWGKSGATSMLSQVSPTHFWIKHVCEPQNGSLPNSVARAGTGSAGRQFTLFQGLPLPPEKWRSQLLGKGFSPRSSLLWKYRLHGAGGGTPGTDVNTYRVLTLLVFSIPPPLPEEQPWPPASFNQHICSSFTRDSFRLGVWKCDCCSELHPKEMHEHPLIPKVSLFALLCWFWLGWR